MLLNKNENKKETKKETKREYGSIFLLKEMVIAESKESVLFLSKSENDYFKFWIRKSAIFTSEYSNILKVSIILDNDFKYAVYALENKDWKKPDNQVDGSKLIEALLEIKKVKLLNEK